MKIKVNKPYGILRLRTFFVSGVVSFEVVRNLENLMSVEYSYNKYGPILYQVLADEFSKNSN